MILNEDLSVSVVVPFYNRSRFLKRLLDSVAAQTLSADKIYIIDNGSSLEETLNAWDIIKAHTLIDRCVFTSTINKGNANYARNLGYELATTKYVAFLDSDDWWEKDHLAQSIECLSISSNVAVYSGAVIHADNNIIINKSVDIQSFNDPFSLVMSPKGYIAQTSSYIVNKKILKNSVKWSEDLKRQQDYDYFAEIYYNSMGWVYSPNPNVNIDWNEGGSNPSKVDAQSLINYYVKWNHLFPDNIRENHLKNMLYLAHKIKEDNTTKQFFYNELKTYNHTNTLKNRVKLSNFYLSRRTTIIKLLDKFKLKNKIKNISVYFKE